MKNLFAILLSVLLLSAHSFAQTSTAAFTAKPNSPIALGQHPRIFLTQAAVLETRERIRTYYKDDFQKFISDLDNFYSMPAGADSFAEWNHVFGAARSYALAYQIDPASVGVRARYTKRDYGKKALELGLHIARNLRDNFTEDIHGVKNLATAEGGVASLALQVVYDWTHDLATLEERRALTNRLITMWNNRYKMDKEKLENHAIANTHVLAGALCFYNDRDLGPTFEASAKQMMDSFQDVFITRQLGTAARLFEGSSDWHEGDAYAFDAYVGLMFLAAASGPALSEDFFATNPWLHDAPYYIYYSMMPMPYQGNYYLAQVNTSTAMESPSRYTSGIMNIAAASLYKTDPTLAGFAAWFCEQSPYGVDVNAYDHYEPHLFDFFYKFMFGTKHIPKKSPEAAGLPVSYKLGQMSVMRSDHGFNDATVLQFMSPKYWYPNGHNEEDMGAFHLHRFGTLAVSSVNSKNSSDGIPRAGTGGKSMAHNNVLGLGPDKELLLQKGRIRNEHELPEHYVPGSVTDIGTVEAREHRPGLYDYVNYNYTASYKEGTKASLARRALVYLRGAVNQEYVLVLDRVQSAQQKYFIMHTPTDLEAVNGAWQAAGPGQWKSTARTHKVVNRIDRSHGQMYITSVLPQNATLHKFGGPGYEWVWADGSPVAYGGEFGEIARYLLGAHTLHIRSQENLFLTAMQVGDANTMGAPAAVENISSASYAGVLLNQERLVLFSKDELKLKNFSYTITSAKNVQHLLTELEPNREFTVKRGGRIIASGSTGANGTIAFADLANDATTYTVTVGANSGSNTNQPPQAVAQATPTSGAAPLAVKFSGQNSKDADGSIAAYAWSFGNGASSSLMNPEQVYNAPGNYTATLTVTDDKGASHSANVAITVTAPQSTNQAPQAVAQASTTSCQAPAAVNFTGANSKDPDGSITAHVWNFGDGNSASAANPQHTYRTPGHYTATLTVTDNGGLQASASVAVSVTQTPSGNQRPMAKILTPSTGLCVANKTSVSYSGEGMDAKGGVIADSNFTWQEIKPNGTTAFLKKGARTGAFKLSPEGKHVLQCIVRDSAGLADTASVTIHVGESGASNTPPQAVLAANPTSGQAPLVVQFTGSNSTDAEGGIASYAWNFGDGASATIANPQHTYTTPGNFTATLTVTDQGGLTHSASVVINVGLTVVNSGNQAPVARILTPENNVTVLNKTSISYSGEGMDKEDGALPAANFTWRHIKPNGVAALLRTSVTTGKVKLQPVGKHTLQCIVTDSKGASDTAQVVINVVATMPKSAELDSAQAQPLAYVLEQNYPNPFNPSTTIAFSLEEAGHVRLSVFNALGQHVDTIVNAMLPAGQHRRQINATDWPSGLYFYALEVNGVRQMKSMTLAK